MNLERQMNLAALAALKRHIKPGSPFDSEQASDTHRQHGQPPQGAVQNVPALRPSPHAALQLHSPSPSTHVPCFTTLHITTDMNPTIEALAQSPGDHTQS